MRIEKVSLLKQGFYKVEMDNGDSFKAHEESIVRYRLISGAELEPEEYNRVREAIQYDRAYVQSLKYISYKLRSIHELENHLSEDYDESIIAQTVYRLKDEGYLNDERYGEALKNTMLNTTEKGPGALKRELIKHHIDEDIVVDMVTLFDREIDEERMNKIKDKLLKRHKGAYRQFKMKLFEKLYQKGYDKSHMELISFDDDFDEESHFEKDFEKYYNKYMKKGSVPDSKQKLIQALMRRGYNYDMIQEKLGGIEDGFFEHNDQT